jgi:hypothetical protein
MVSTRMLRIAMVSLRLLGDFGVFPAPRRTGIQPNTAILTGAAKVRKRRAATHTPIAAVPRARDSLTSPADVTTLPHPLAAGATPLQADQPGRVSRPLRLVV